jgi:hypothetical protein
MAEPFGRLRRTRCAVFAAVGCALVAMGLPLSAAASVPIFSFDTQPSTTQAGAHPDVEFSFEVGNRQQNPTPCDCGDSRDVTVHLPTGLIGNTSATPKCTIAQFASYRCPVDSQLGVSEDRFSSSSGVHDGFGVAAFMAPVFNLVPPPEQPALLAFETILGTPVFIDVSARTNSDYGVDATVYNIDHTYPLFISRTIIWGVPAASVHNYLRFGFEQEPTLELGIPSQLCDAEGVESTDDPATVYQLCAGREVLGAVGEQPAFEAGVREGPGHPVASESPEYPFFQNPTTCGEASLFTSLQVLAYDGGETEAVSPYPPTTDCAQLSFNPSQAIEPTTHAADSPSGAEFRLTVPQFESPSVPSPSELKAAHVTLPEGFSLAPNVTNGKTTCSNAQARIGTTEEAQCPEDSKIGTIYVETPVLPGVLPGAVYLGEPKAGNRFRMILAFNGFGVHVKLPGTVTPDPKTGQIHIDFDNLPQAPFAYFDMHIFGSERGPLDTPTRCGTYEVSSEWTPWDSALSNQVSRQTFTIDEGPNGTPCPNGPRPFHPGFAASSTASTAAAHTDFWLNLSREDGEQDLSGLTVTTPPGFAATLRGVSYCPDPAIAAAALVSHSGLSEQQSPSCPVSSQVGEFTTGSGPGAHPLFLPGKVYLAGPYKGAPLSFVFIVPAVSGGYDLGNVVVRAAVEVNPETAQVTTVSDPLPQIFEGIPLRLRQLFVDLNRPDFAINPTNCDPFSVDAAVSGAEGGLFEPATHFQVANCAALPFKPKLAIRLSGSPKRSGSPALRATVTMRPGESGISRAQVSLPHSEFLDNAHIGQTCGRPQLTAGKCPPGSIYGHATAETPLLAKPLEGPVYLGTGYGTRLPELIADLNGQFRILLRGKVDTDKQGGIRNTFEVVPDAPVSKFTLSLDGGDKSLLENSAPLCTKRRYAHAVFSGQNGKVQRSKILLQASCDKRRKRHRGLHRTQQDRRAAR